MLLLQVVGELGVFYLIENDILLVIIILVDDIKVDVVEIVVYLKLQGKFVVFLSGDQEVKVVEVVGYFGIEEYYGV